jgi:hypothetical protein
MFIPTSIIKEDCNHEEVIAEIITEAVNKLIPPTLKAKLPKQSFRKAQLEKYGPSAFLQPDKLKFPVKDHNGNNHPGLIKAAYIRARQHGHQDIAQKAKELMREHDDIPINIQIEGSDEIIEIDILLDNLELDFTEINKLSQGSKDDKLETENNDITDGKG